MRYGGSRERTCAECGKMIMLRCLPREYTYRMMESRTDSETKKQTKRQLYFYNDGCRNAYNRQHPRKTYPKYNWG